MKVLFLSAWYPTPQDMMAGLFVQKHAEAVAQQGHDVRVLYSNKTGIGWARDMYMGWKQLKKEWGTPDIVQMNVLDKNGVIAMWLKRRYHIPYVIVEHWSGYLPANFSFREGWHGRLMRKIAQNASCILPVSQMLEEAMKKCGIANNHWERIHNVVDDFFYEAIRRDSERNFRFLHVSCFDEQAKNIQGILRAARKLAKERQDFELVLVGTGIDFDQDLAYANSLGFPADMLTFVGEQTPYEVDQWMQQSDCFLLFSRYETFAVVLAEAIAVGIPFISSSTAGIAAEQPNHCGILVPSEDEKALTKAMSDMLSNHHNFSKKEIKVQGEKYTYQNVGKQLSDLYQRLVISMN